MLPSSLKRRPVQNRLPTLFVIALVTASTCFGENPEANTHSADFNQDGHTDNADLDQWEAAFDLSGSNPSLTADSDNDGDTDGADFLAWQRGYDGYRLPEPTTFVLAMHLLLAMLTRRRRSPAKRRHDTAHNAHKPVAHKRRVLTDLKQC